MISGFEGFDSVEGVTELGEYVCHFEFIEELFFGLVKNFFSLVGAEEFTEVAAECVDDRVENKEL